MSVWGTSGVPLGYLWVPGRPLGYFWVLWEPLGYLGYPWSLWGSSGEPWVTPRVTLVKPWLPGAPQRVLGLNQAVT